jgi:hypothetical protein
MRTVPSEKKWPDGVTVVYPDTNTLIFDYPQPMSVAAAVVTLTHDAFVKIINYGPDGERRGEPMVSNRQDMSTF